MNNDTEKITKLQNALCCLIGPSPKFHPMKGRDDIF